MARLFVDLCLSDIPKERIKTAANGKKYLKVVINPRREPDSDGFDHYVAVSVPQAERNADDRPLFIGRAQERKEQQQPRHDAPARQQPSNPDDLPF